MTNSLVEAVVNQRKFCWIGKVDVFLVRLQHHFFLRNKA